MSAETHANTIIHSTYTYTFVYLAPPNGSPGSAYAQIYIKRYIQWKYWKRMLFVEGNIDIN